MTYYVRYAFIDDQSFGLAELEAGLYSIDPRYIIDADLLVLDDEGGCGARRQQRFSDCHVAENNKPRCRSSLFQWKTGKDAEDYQENGSFYWNPDELDNLTS